MVLDEIMTREPLIGHPDWTLRQVLETFHEENIRHLPVVHDDELVGMISERDVTRELLPEDSTRDHPEEAREHLDKTIAEVMIGGVVALESEAEVSEAIDVMVEHKLGAVAVVHPEDGQLVGIVTWIDVVRAARELFD